MKHHPADIAKPGHLATAGPILLPRSPAQQKRVTQSVATSRKVANLPTPVLNWKLTK